MIFKFCKMIWNKLSLSKTTSIQIQCFRKREKKYMNRYKNYRNAMKQ